jgi:hypothetical protein
VVDEDRWASLKDEHQLHPEDPVSFLAHRGEDGDVEEPSASPVLPSDDRFETLVDQRVETDRSLGRGRLGVVVNLDRLSKRERDQIAKESAREDGHDDGRRRLPLTRQGCDAVPRPCPHVGCRHHLYLDAQPGGNLRVAFADLEPEQLQYSCSLDIADGGPRILDEMATVLGVTRERTRQIFERALRKFRERLVEAGITAEDAMVSDAPVTPYV